MLTDVKYSKFIKIAVCFFIATTAIFLLANFALAANFWGGDTNGTGFANNAGLPGAGMDLRIIIANIIRIVLGFLGMIAVILIIYGGFIWMTSAGDEQKIEQAKAILKNALIGLIIIILSFAIASFVLNLLAGATGGGGQNGPGNGPPSRYGLSALGNGIIQSHYPARDQKEVPRNTSIIITFRESILASTLCATADTAINAKCNSELTNQSVIRIFKQSEEAICVAGPTGCTSLVEAKVYTQDDKTFVFVPVNYLGSPSEYINYTVYLGNGLKRQSGCQAGNFSRCDRAFPGISGDYGWSFEVSNKIDLDPPIVKNNGVFPPPDNARDTKVSVSDAAQAHGTITVSSPRVYSRASVSGVSPSGITPAASVEVNETCSRGGSYNITIADGPISTLYTTDAQGNTINLGQGTINGQTATFSLCNLKLTNTSNFSSGNLWTFIINSMIAADTITVGNITYTAISGVTGGTNFKVGPANADTAQNIVSVLNSNPEITASAAINSSIVIVKARIAGVAGNSINLLSSNSARLTIVAMDWGTDKVDKVTVEGGRGDQPMNSAIQINFNEAIMPLTVSGTADEVKNFIRVVNADPNAKVQGEDCLADADCKSFVCSKLKEQCAGGTDYYLKGKFAVSNQYSTVEFLSDKECGFNNCGEKIYCLPANSHLKVELNAASLISCEKSGAADNSLCVDKSPFNTCDLTRKFCRDNVDSNKYFPQAAKTYSSIVNGIVDMAFNSLDGNRDGSAYGPASFYNENTPVPADGDNYKWSFFISDVLNLTPPKIKDTTPIINGINVPLADKITISFDKLMLSSRLTTGSLTILNGRVPITHYLLNLRSLADQPVGYWVTNLGQQSVPGSGVIDRTDAYINHSAFNKSSTYKAQAGSGLKDIYQNCFLPCSSESLTGTPSCCDGAAHVSASCP